MTGLASSRGADLLVAGLADGRVKAWWGGAEGAPAVAQRPHRAPVTQVLAVSGGAGSPDAAPLAVSASEDGTLCLMPAAPRRRADRCGGHSSPPARRAACLPAPDSRHRDAGTKRSPAMASCP